MPVYDRKDIPGPVGQGTLGPGRKHGCPPGLAKRNLSQLTALVKPRLKRMQYRPGLLGGFLASTGLDLTPFCAPRY